MIQRLFRDAVELLLRVLCFVAWCAHELPTLFRWKRLDSSLASDESKVVRFKGVKPSPPKTIAIVWAEAAVHDSTVRQLADIIKWSYRDGLHDVICYDPEGDLKHASSELLREVAARFPLLQVDVSVGWGTGPSGASSAGVLRCEACRSGTQQQQHPKSLDGKQEGQGQGGPGDANGDDAYGAGRALAPAGQLASGCGCPCDGEKKEGGTGEQRCQPCGLRRRHCGQLPAGSALQGRKANLASRATGLANGLACSGDGVTQPTASAMPEWPMAADATAEVGCRAPSGKVGLQEEQQQQGQQQQQRRRQRATGCEGAVEGGRQDPNGAPQAVPDGVAPLLPLGQTAEPLQQGQQQQRHVTADCGAAHSTVANGHDTATLTATGHQQQQRHEHVRNPPRSDPRPRLRLHVVSAEDGYRPVLVAAASGGVCGGCGAVVQLRAPGGGSYREAVGRLRLQMAEVLAPHSCNGSGEVQESGGCGVLLQPELVLVVGPVLTLAGYPPFQVAASEILHLGPAGGMAGGGGRACRSGGGAAGARGQGPGLWGKKAAAGCGVSRAAVEAAMARFLRTEQRFGK